MKPLWKSVSPNGVKSFFQGEKIGDGGYFLINDAVVRRGEKYQFEFKHNYIAIEGALDNSKESNDIRIGELLSQWKKPKVVEVVGCAKPGCLASRSPPVTT